MDEEAVAKQEEQPKTEEKKEEKPEEKKEEKASEEKKDEEKAEPNKEEQPPPPPPPPFVLYVDLHCTGCAKKIERSILKIRGVEGVVTDMAQNQVTIKGVVEPQAVCNMIENKCKRRAKVLSPPPPAEGEPIPQVVASQVSGLSTVELNVNMHCEACAEQLKRKILKMKGVQTADTELSTGKVTVTGTMDANRLVDYVYRRTKKQAQVVPQPPPEPEKPKDEPEKPPEEAAKEEPKGEEKKEPEPEKKEEAPPAEAEKKGEKPQPPEGGGDGVVIIGGGEREALLMQQKLMYYYQYPPLYVMERIPSPQLFSDENPNACCIT